jgi:hypothetical protein
MLFNFAIQSILPYMEVRQAAPPCVTRPASRRLHAGGPVWTAGQWRDYFRANLARYRRVPWHRGAGASDAELAAIVPSLQVWQRGETSDGRHLRAAAERYARHVGEPEYPTAVELFIREEQRHGELLGRWLDLAGAGRIRSDWGDRLFRAARYCLREMETWTTPVVMVEVLAMVYYNAIRRATRSAVLTAICKQLLADEVPRMRFQCERLAILMRNRSPFAVALTMLLHRLGFAAVVLLVWLGHRRALRAGGYDWRHYRRAAWSRMSLAWRLMDPRRYRRPG